MRNHPPPRLPYALNLMKPRSRISDYMIEREGACTQRKSDFTPTASEAARRSRFQRMLFTSSPPPASSLTIQDLYPRFHKLFRHTYGRKRSPYRQQFQEWLRSLGKNSICSNCRETRWKCDTKELRCGACNKRHATCPRTLQFKKLFIMREMCITEDVYDKLLKLIPQRRNSRKRGVGASSSAHPPTRQSHQGVQNSKQKQVRSVLSDVESEEEEAESEEGMDSEEEVDELDPSEPSSDGIPLQSMLSSNHSAPTLIPLLSPGPPYVNRSMEATRLTQIRPARVTFPTAHRGPMRPPTFTLNSAPSSAPMATASLDSHRIVSELSGIRLALTRIEENMSKFLSNHASAQPPGTADRGTHITPFNPSPFIVSESLPVPRESQLNIVDTEIRGENSENGNVENTWRMQTSGEQQRRRPTDDQIPGESSDLMIEGSLMTPPHVLPMIVTLEERDASPDR